MYCKHIDKEKYDVHYVGFDFGLPKREIENVAIHYIPIHYNKLKRYWIYVKSINKLIRKENFNILFLVDCQASLLIRLCNMKRKSILDIRTGDIQIKNRKISFFNIKIWFLSYLFKNITIISNSLRESLHLPSEKCHLLPLGAEAFDLPPKTFKNLMLFYIGTLQNRKIYQTIEGLYLFLKVNTGILVHYNIVGFGDSSEEKKLLDSIKKYQLENIVTFHGRKNHYEVMNLFEKSNFGVVYVPITKGYNCQPTTKLYESVLAGMPVIATKTLENELSIGLADGVLIQDTPAAFAKGLEKLILNSYMYNSDILKLKFEMYSWENIVKQNLEPYLNQIC